MKETPLHSIRQVKKELRTLGIAVKERIDDGRFNIVGIIYRGNLLLDGVMKTVASGPDLTSDIAEMIKSSPHYEQVRILILEHPLTAGSASINPLKLSSSISKPILILSTIPKSPYVGDEVTPLQIIRRGKSLNVMHIGLKRRDAEKIIKTASRPDEDFPECLRVASIILESLAECENTKRLKVD